MFYRHFLFLLFCFTFVAFLHVFYFFLINYAFFLFGTETINQKHSIGDMRNPYSITATLQHQGACNNAILTLVFAEI